MLVGHSMGAAGARVVIEEFLAGEEASFIVMADGRHVLPLAFVAGSQAAARSRRRPQHRRHGCVLAPAPVITPALHARIMREVILPDGERHGRRRDSLTRDSCTRRDGRLGRHSEGAEFNCRLAIRKRSRSW
jgi:hypothetical protein